MRVFFVIILFEIDMVEIEAVYLRESLLPLAVMIVYTISTPYKLYSVSSVRDCFWNMSSD